MKIKIYCIIDINGLKYVGKTSKKYLSSRLAVHRYGKKNNIGCSSEKLDLDNCKIILLYECEKHDAPNMEQYFKDNIKCVNKYNPVLDKAIEHFKSVDNNLKELWVEEWDTTIYYKEKSAFRDQSAIMQLHQQGKVVEALVETIIVKSLNKDGSKMFKPAERTILLNNVDPDVLVKIATSLNTVDDNYDVGETVKN